MESPNSTEPDKPVVQPVPAVDTSQLFHKDPEPVVSSPKRNPLARQDRKKLLVLALLIVFVLIGGGLVFAQFNKSDKQSTTQQTSEDKVENTDYAEGNYSTSTDQDVTSDGSTPSSSSTSRSTGDTGTTNTSSGGDASTGGGGSGSSSGSGGTATSSPKTHYISYTNNCYISANVTIKKGDTVKFTNKSTRDMEPASNFHPSHEEYKEFDANGSVGPGGTYSFIFNNIGPWGYHDHIKPSCKGTITVQ